MFEMLAVIAACAVYSLFSKRLSRTVLTLPLLFTGLGLLLSVPLHAALPPEAVQRSVSVGRGDPYSGAFCGQPPCSCPQVADELGPASPDADGGHAPDNRIGNGGCLWAEPGDQLCDGALDGGCPDADRCRLAQLVVTNPDVPEHLGRTINVESGLNDGLALPFVLLGATLALMMVGHEPVSGTNLALEALAEVAFGAGRRCHRLGCGKGDGLGADPRSDAGLRRGGVLPG